MIGAVNTMYSNLPTPIVIIIPTDNTFAIVAIVLSVVAIALTILSTYLQNNAARKQMVEMEHSRMDTIRPLLVPRGDMPVFDRNDNEPHDLQISREFSQNKDNLTLDFSNKGAGVAMNIHAIFCMPMIHPAKPHNEWTVNHCFRALEGNVVGVAEELTFTFVERGLFGGNPAYNSIALQHPIAVSNGIINHGRLMLGYEDLYGRQLLNVYDLGSWEEWNEKSE